MSFPIDPPFRAEHIGSLVRPEAVLEAREARAAGRIDDAGLRAVEDAEIEKTVAFQAGLGLCSVSDGEFRRHSYTDSFGTAVFASLRTAPTDDPNWRYTNQAGETSGANVSVVEDRLVWEGPANVADFAYLADIAPQGCVPKMTLPGPCHIHFRAGRDNIDRAAYPDLDAFWADVIESYEKEIAALRDAGCRYIQLDETSIAKFGDPKIRRGLEERGDDWRALLDLYIEVIAEVARRTPPDVALGLHLCRGNKAGAWQAEGGYDDVAARLFRDLPIRFYFLEYDSPRAGGFQPLAELPDGKVVVLGLVSTKIRALEDAGALERRIEEASRYVAIERLCLSPQCGFAGDIGGTGLDAADQAAKLALVIEVARRVWG
ncbi:MAG: 5-methyltetrahydropteroyltriglutamate--homocysteine S-methyltransferase [Defluviicoccus sp.]|nr:5-methyltetrahydropteroyltriglutamate--homocysteine S-methyltransferase [Defluviicoccus sp.]